MAGMRMAGDPPAPRASAGPISLTRATTRDVARWKRRAKEAPMIDLIIEIHEWRSRALRVRAEGGALLVELHKRDGKWSVVGTQKRA